MESMIMLCSVPLTALLVVGMASVVKLVLVNSIFLKILVLYNPWEELPMATIETGSHSTFVYTVNPVVLSLDSFDVLFLELVQQLRLTW